MLIYRGEIINFSDVRLSSDCKHEKIKDCKVYSVIEGEWSGFLLFDNVKYWQCTDYNLIPLTEMPFTLPSDSGTRLDLKYLIEGDETNSQKFKEQYEEIQRHDRKLREDALKQNK
jgi:hypothetical protein